MTTRLPQIFGIAALALIALVAAGCTDHSNPDSVDRRSVERWNYLIAHEAEKAYDYLTPGYRATQTREAYAAAMNNRPVQWKGAKFKQKTCDGERCQVEVDVTYRLMTPGMGGKAIETTSTQAEIWIYSQGDWYFLPN